MNRDPIQNHTLQLMALGELCQDYGGRELAQQTLRTGGATRDFMTAIANRVRLDAHKDAADRMLGLDPSRPEVKNYSITRALRASMESQWDNAPLEKDVDALASARSGQVANGFFLPYQLMAGGATRDFNAGTPGEAGNLIGAGLHTGHVPDPLRGVCRLTELGATVLRGLRVTTELPRFTSGDNAGWKSEVFSAPAILTQTGLAILEPKRVTALAVMSRQALLQATPQLDAAFIRMLSKALWEQIEHAALNGDGLNDNPVGVRHTAGIGSVVGGTDGALLTYEHLCDMEHKPALANVEETDSTGYLVNAKTRRYLRTKARAAGLPFIWEGGERPLLGHRAAVSNLAPSDLDKGSSTGVCSSVLYGANWSELFIGLYGPGVDVIVDRMSLAPEGKVRIVANAYVGVAVNLPEAFSKMDDSLLA